MNGIFYFSADWCQPCKETKPLVEELNDSQTIVKFFIIDVDVAQDLTQLFEIKSVPTFILIKDGEESKRLMGQQNRWQLEEMVNHYKQ